MIYVRHIEIVFEPIYIQLSLYGECVRIQLLSIFILFLLGSGMMDVAHSHTKSKFIFFFQFDIYERQREICKWHLRSAHSKF